jgi:hypothetical protein
VIVVDRALPSEESYTRPHAGGRHIKPSQTLWPNGSVNDMSSATPTTGRDANIHLTVRHARNLRPSHGVEMLVAAAALLPDRNSVCVSQDSSTSRQPR